MIERWKGIAQYISQRTGLTFSEESIRKASQRQKDPLPLVYFGGRVAAKSCALDAWINRQHGRRKAA